MVGRGGNREASTAALRLEKHKIADIAGKTIG